MKTKSLLLLLIVCGMFSSILLGQTTEMSGKVLAVSSTTITVQKGTEIWDIKRTSTTSVTGTLKLGSTVTVKYNTPDAQKKEGELSTQPTAAPESH